MIAPPAIEVLPAEQMGYSGTERLVGQLSSGFNKRGHDTTVIASRGSYLLGVEIVETVPARYGGIQHEETHFQAYKDFLKSEEFDWVDDHTHFFRSHQLGLKNISWSIHDSLPLENPPVRVPMYARSKAHAEYLSELWKCNVDYIYNGVQLDHYRYEENKGDYLLFFGRCNSYKGSIAFAEMCERLGVRGVMAGEDSELRGVPLETVKQILIIANRYPKLHYLGRVSETKKIELLSKAKALVSPLIEPYFPVFDLTLVESQATGTPVICTDRGASREVIRDGETGFVVRNVDEIPDYVDRLNEIDPKACRRNAERFSVERMVNKYIKSYGNMVG